MKETRKCGICGKEFFSIVYNSKYCGHECAMIANKNNMKRIQREQSLKRKEKKPEVKPEKKMTITEIAVAARESGMTYGQYVVKMGL